MMWMITDGNAATLETRGVADPANGPLQGGSVCKSGGDLVAVVDGG